MEPPSGFDRLDLIGNDEVLSCMVGGDGPPMLLLHGCPQTAAEWKPTLPGTEVFAAISHNPRAWHFFFHGVSEVPEAIVDNSGDYYITHLINGFWGSEPGPSEEMLAANLQTDFLYRRKVPGEGDFGLLGTIAVLTDMGPIRSIGPETFSQEMNDASATDAVAHNGAGLPGLMPELTNLT